MLQTLQNWDLAALIFCRSWINPHASWFPIVQTLVRVFSDAEPILFGVLLLVVWLWARFRTPQSDAPKKAALQAFWTTVFVFVVYTLLNQFLPARPRPEDAYSALAPLISHLPDNSFPSGHAIFAAASVGGIFAFLGRRTAWWFLLLGVLTCIARVFAGIHYPGDILAGFAVGTVLAMVFLPIVRLPAFDRFFLQPILRLAKHVRL